MRRLKEADAKYQVSITSDLPPEDRKLIRKQVELAKEKEKNEGEGGRWKFRVRGPPWDLKIVQLAAERD